MRKFLRLSLVSLLSLVCTGLYAATEVIDFTQLTITETSDGFTLQEGSFSFEAVKNNGATTPTQNERSKDIRLYAKNTLAVTSNKPMTKMVFAISEQGLKRWADVTPSTGTVTNDVDNAQLIWTSTDAVSDVTFTVGDKATHGTDGAGKAGQFDFNSVEITTEDGAVSVSAPTFSLDGGVYTEAQTLTLTADEGCTVYYTNDGTTPSNESTKYTAPITIDKTTTIKAIAYDANNNASGVVSKTYTFPIACENIASVKQLEAGTLVALTLTDAQVVYVNTYQSGDYTNTDIYIRDASGAIDFYNTGLELKVNDIVNGTVIGEFTVYNGLPEIEKNDETNGDGLNVTEGTEAEPTEITNIADLLTDKYLCDLIVIKGATVTSEKSGNYTNYYAVDENDNKVMLYDKFKLGVEIPTDAEKYDITGIMGSANLSGKTTNEVFLIGIEKNIPSGINNVTVDELDENAPVYNLAGQRVSKDAKGIVIQNGKKYIRR